MAFCGECGRFHMPMDVHGKDTLDGVAHTLRQVRDRLKGLDGPAVVKKGFDRNVYHKDYMKTYMRKWRARRKGDGS